MWFAVTTLETPANVWRSRSSKPKRGAGRTIVVSGKMLRTTSSPLACKHISSTSQELELVLHLCAEELGGGVLICTGGRDMDEAVNVVFCYCFYYPFCSLNMDVFEAEVLRRVVASYKIVYYIGMSDAFLE